MFILTPQSNTQVEKSAQALINFKSKNPKKAVFSCFIGGERIAKALDMLKAKNVINFREPDFFAKAIAKLF